MRNCYYQLLNYINTTEVHDVYYHAALEILKHLEKIPGSSIVQVADFCYASTATISRLCRRLNYTSYAAFKQDVILTLAEFEADDPLHFPSENPNHLTDHAIEDLKKTYFQEVIHSLEYTYDHISAKDIEDVVRLIDQSARIIFIGFNFTQMVTSQFQGTLAHDHKEVVGYNSEAWQIELLKQTRSDDLIILTSITGNYFYRKPEATQLFMQSPAKKVIITQATKHECLGCATKLLHISGKENASYIGKYSVLMLFELLEMTYMRWQEMKKSNVR